jgi:hypothetical protein
MNLATNIAPMPVTILSRAVAIQRFTGWRTRFLAFPFMVESVMIYLPRGSVDRDQQKLFIEA